MLRLLVVQGEYLLELFTIIMLPGLVGVIILFGQMLAGGRLLGWSNGLLGCDGSRLRCFLDRTLSIVLVLNGHGTHLGQLAHFAFDLVGNDIRRVLLTQTTGNEHQPFYLIDMRQHLLDRHIHN